MSLKIVYGRAGSGKSSFLLEDMTSYEDALYIVPEQFSFSAEKKIIDKFKICGLGNPEVLSFHRLAEKIIDKCGFNIEILSDKAAREMLVSYCANSIIPEKMTLFEGLVRKNMISSTASELITTFKRYNITPKELSSAAQKTTDKLLFKKLTDSAIILEAYNTKLSECGVCDPEDIIFAASKLLKENRTDFLCGRSVYIDQFSDFDPEQYDFIGEILKQAEQVCVGLCFDDNSVFAPVKRTYERLISLANKLHIKIDAEEYCPGAMKTASPMIKHLEKCYFSENDAPFSGTDGRIRIFCGKNPSSEIHSAAQNICALVRDRGYRFRDISIVARDIEEYKSLIDRIFPKYDIPVFLDRKIPLSGHCVTLYITSVLEIMISGFTYENIFRYIKSPFSPIDPKDSDTLENYCLSCGIRPYMWKKPFRSFSDKKTDEETLIYINSLREAVYLPLAELTEKLSGKMKTKELCRRLFGFFEKTGLEDKIRMYAEKLEENGENLYALQTVQVYNMLTGIVSTLCTVMGNEEMDIHTFYNTVCAGLSSVEIGTIPSESDCVNIGSIDRIKGHGAKAVFLIGLNSGKFPAALTEQGLFSDDDRHALLKLGIELPPGISELAESEQLLVYDALTCAKRRLYLSYAISDSSGGSLLSSEIINRIRMLFPDVLYEDNITSDIIDERIITSKKAVFEILAAKLPDAALNGKPLDEILSAAAFFFQNDEEYAPLLKNAILAAGYTNASQTVSKQIMEKISGNEMKTSISRLEAYNKCPFSYFSKYVLCLKPREFFEVLASDSGSFLHDFLNRFSECVSHGKASDGTPLTWKNIDDEFINLTTDRILSELINSLNENYLERPRIKALFMRLRRVARQSVYAVRRHIVKSDFIPLGYEISFDEDGTFKPIKITLADGKKVTLRGRIDRADVFENESGKYARIVDYKSGDKALNLQEVYYGLQLQLFVYLSSICENGYKPAGILYCTLADKMVDVKSHYLQEDLEKERENLRKMRGIVLSEDNIAEHMGGSETLRGKDHATYKNFNSMFRHLKKEIQKSASAIYNGKFPIEHTEKACDFCDYASVCRFDPVFSGCSVKKFDKLSNDEIWQRTEAETNELD